MAKKSHHKKLKKIIIKESNLIWDSFVRILHALSEWDYKDNKTNKS